ncbi:beta-propeller fold lactonase family protein [Pandoraea sputorum]|uniref:6-phosphogluconolactonase n=1 Tax=Pandoraea sputorum TaxID=93222 RepID=A0A5E5AT32_9BURK|nr:beta-propeller fold lactonase family protein [Pandoraea sputorum]VVE75745.1 hypothetical protein PSP31121_00589 [Pandoraea sputorum]
MGLYSYVLGGNHVLAYDVLSDGSLIALGDPAPLSFPTNNVMCASGDTIFAISVDEKASPAVYLDIFQADRVSGRLLPRVQRQPLGVTRSDGQTMAVVAPNTEVFYIYYGGEDDTGSSRFPAIHAYMYAPRFKTVSRIGQLLLDELPSLEQLQSDGSGQLIYASLGSREYGLASFAVDVNGMLRNVDKTRPGKIDYALGVDPSRNFVYSASVINPKMTGYRVDKGKFSLLEGVAEHLAGQVPAITITADGKYLFVCTTVSPFTNIGQNTVVSHAIDPETGVLTPLNEQQDAYMSLSMATTPDGKYLYAASFDDKDIYRYELNEGRLSRGTLAARANVEIQNFVLVSEP